MIPTERIVNIKKIIKQFFCAHNSSNSEIERVRGSFYKATTKCCGCNKFLPVPNYVHGQIQQLMANDSYYNEKGVNT